MRNALAEVEEQPFEDQDGTGAAEDGERLASQQTEDPTGDGRAQKALQHALHTTAQTPVRLIIIWKGESRQSAGLRPDLHVFRSVPQQAAERDGVGHGAQVNKQDGRQGLDVKRVGEVTDEERRFSFDVKQQTPTKPESRDTEEDAR